VSLGARRRKFHPRVITFSADLAEKRQYFLNKIAWMIENDLAREALHTMWFGFGTLIARQNVEDQSALALGVELSKQWLRNVGWEGEDVLRIKSEAAHSLMAEMEQLANQGPAEPVRPVDMS